MTKCPTCKGQYMRIYLCPEQTKAIKKMVDEKMNTEKNDFWEILQMTFNRVDQIYTNKITTKKQKQDFNEFMEQVK